jgi:transposase-like protein
MDPRQVFCPNSACPASGRKDAGNIRVHSQQDHRYRCRVCGKTFTETKGTVFYRRQLAADLISTIVTLFAYGCPPKAIEHAYALDERTVNSLLRSAGQHCQPVHEQLVQQPRDLGQVQADELRVKAHSQVLWVAMALQVSTRLWLGAELSAQRGGALLRALIQRVRACALCRPLLFCVDGWRAYPRVMAQIFREALPTGQRGRPHLRPWDNVCVAQRVKQYAQGHVVGIVRRVLQGSVAQVATLIQASQGHGDINTAYIERLNATFRARLTRLVRRGRALAHQTRPLQAGLYLVGTVYNFCTDHASLRVAGIINGHKWLPRTPAMAAGLADHRWSVPELLAYQVPPPRWTPPKQRGRRSQAMKQLIQQWG